MNTYKTHIDVKFRKGQRMLFTALASGDHNPHTKLHLDSPPPYFVT